MMNQARQPTSLSWGILATGMAVTLVISLSIHVVMLQVLGVAFPDRSAVTPWARLLDGTLAALALLVFHDLARPRLSGIPPWGRALIVAALYAGLKEVARGAAMNGVVTTGHLFSAATTIIPVLHCISVGVLVVAVAPRLHGPWMKLAAALIIAALMLFAIRPLIDSSVMPFIGSISYLAHDDVYPFPYGLHVLIWAYLTYLEPVVACTIIAALVWPALSRRAVIRTVQFVALIMFMKGSVIPTFVFGFFNPAGAAQGALSESQFLLETLALGLLVALVWPLAPRFGRPAS